MVFTLVMGASSGSPCSLASEALRKPSEPTERTSSEARRTECREPRAASQAGGAELSAGTASDTNT